MVDETNLWALLEVVGEPTVKVNLAKGIYGDEKRPLVKEWLRDKAQSRADGAMREQLDIARNAAASANVAAVAARDAADEARKANKKANIALWIAAATTVIAAATTIVAIIALVLS